MGALLQIVAAVASAELAGAFAARHPLGGIALGVTALAFVGELHARGRRLPAGARWGLVLGVAASVGLPALGLAGDPYRALPASAAWPLGAVALALLSTLAFGWLLFEPSAKVAPAAPPEPQSAAKPFARGALCVGLTATAALLPISIAGTQLALGFTAGALLLALAIGARPQRRFALDLPFALLLGAAGLSLALARSPERPWRVTALWALLAYFVLTRALALADGRAEAEGPGSRSEDGRAPTIAARLVAVWGSASAAVCALGLLQHRNGFDLVAWLGLRSAAVRVLAPESPGHFAAIGTFNSRLALAHATLAPLGILLGLSLVGAWRGRARLFAALALALELAGIWATFARAAWVAIAIVLGAATLAATGPRTRHALRGILALGLVAGLLFALSPGARSWGAAGLRPSRNQDRLFLWARAAQVALDHPVHGVGFGGYPRLLGPYYDRYDRGFFMRTWAHDQPLSLLCETGPLGLFAFLWLFVQSAGLAWLSRVARREAAPLLRGLCLGAALAAVGFCVVSLFHDALYHGVVAYNLVFALGLGAWAKERIERPLPSGRPAIDSPTRC